MQTEERISPNTKKIEELNAVTIRFAGDSGDGMQLTGSQFTTTSALIGNDIVTYPNFPAEIRAPQGTIAGVSGFQVRFSSTEIHTAGDDLDVLVAMNPAAFKVNVEDLKQNGLLIINKDSFTGANLKKAGYISEDEDIFASYKSKIRICEVPITSMTMTALEESSLPSKAKERCKNFFALGLMYWVYNRPLEPTMEWLKDKFGGREDVYDANVKALKAGYHFGNTSELFQNSYEIKKAQLESGTYRNITGNEAISLGFVVASELAKKELFLGSYPITPATDILQELAKFKNHGVRTFQAEDEIAGIGSALGAAFGGRLAVTTTSGPGIALKSEFMNLAVITELPIIITDVQRGGPSTGLPTKTEQTDLLQVLFGRNGESPMPVIAAQSPSDCFDAAIEAARIALKYMTPVVLLSDTQIAIGSEPWKLPDVNALEPIDVHYQKALDGEEFLPYARNEDLVRPWAIPGTKGCEHTIGGLEKENITGKVNLSAKVHEEMVAIRAQKIENIAKSLKALNVHGKQEGELLILGWGSTYGSIRAAVDELLEDGKSVAHVHLRHINPLPLDLGDIIKRFKKVLIPELNSGQLRMLIRSRYLVDAQGLNQINTKPLAVSKLVSEANKLLSK
jgi:2-oxoglutarate/2-oxoacid ferredoxin oxidoreductase subunit alpha